jgi:drug/metabolite transporter (DMT)-like permease
MEKLSDSRRAWLQIHFCVILWGFTAILGKAIHLPALPLVWWRMTIVTVALLVAPQFWRGLAKLSLKQFAIFAGIGVLVALHWLTFYGAIKLANASVAATSMALSPVLIAFIEPFIVGRRFAIREALFGLAVIPGVVLVVGGTPVLMRAGIAVGVLSTVFVAAFGSLNKRFVDHGSAICITGIEMGAGSLFLAVVAPLLPKSEAAFVLPDWHDSILLLILAMACTLLPYALSLVALRQLSAFTTGLAVNMEPVYAIFLAMLFFGEQRELTPAFYIGVAIICAVVFSYPFLARPEMPERIHISQ